MILYKKHPFIRLGSQLSHGIMPREIIGPRSIERKGPVRERGISPSHSFNKEFPIWPKRERITILSYKSPPRTISFTNPFARGKFGIPIRPITISTFKQIPYKSPPKSAPKKVISTTVSDSGLIGAGMGAILSILLYLM